MIGGSIGGLVAAAELCSQGFSVTIIEKSKSVGGLYNKVKTPFGLKEVGMHVLYVSNRHFEHLCEIFGQEAFDVLTGPDVDIGASHNFGRTCFDSVYPNICGHPMEQAIFNEMTAAENKNDAAENAAQEAVRRFGRIGGTEIAAPILQKLWDTPPQELTSNALHCFFDLRRMVICDKQKADLLKSDEWLDDVVANPIQSQPKGKVYDGRIGLTFSGLVENLETRVRSWAERKGIEFLFEKRISLQNGALMVDGGAVHSDYDACLFAMPVHNLACEQTAQLDKRELSICYFELKGKLAESFPSYYILCHDQRFKASRVVHYDAYHRDMGSDPNTLIAVEFVHLPGQAPKTEEIAAEINSLLTSSVILSSFRLPNAVPVPVPTIKNQMLLNSVEESIKTHFGQTPIYFSGMRTDTGVFFSHHTIGLAYDSALDCCKQLL